MKKIHSLAMMMGIAITGAVSFTLSSPYHVMWLEQHVCQALIPRVMVP